MGATYVSYLRLSNRAPPGFCQASATGVRNNAPGSCQTLSRIQHGDGVYVAAPTTLRSAPVRPSSPNTISQCSFAHEAGVGARRSRRPGCRRTRSLPAIQRIAGVISRLLAVHGVDLLNAV